MIDALRDALARYRIRFGTEADMQADVEAALTAAGIAADREFRLSTGPIDFRTHTGIGIECKIHSSRTEVMRQCRRYLAEPGLVALLLVTSRAQHLAMPRELGGKPVRTIWVAGNP